MRIQISDNNIKLTPISIGVMVAIYYDINLDLKHSAC